MIVDLEGTGAVARVGGLTADVRDLRGHYSREIAVARWLSTAGAPVVAPHEPAGPFVDSGAAVSPWERAADGAGLRRCHDALESFPASPAPLVSSARIRDLRVLAWSLLASAHEGRTRATTEARLRWLRWLREHPWPG